MARQARLNVLREQAFDLYDPLLGAYEVRHSQSSITSIAPTYSFPIQAFDLYDPLLGAQKSSIANLLSPYHLIISITAITAITSITPIYSFLYPTIGLLNYLKASKQSNVTTPSELTNSPT